VISEVPSASSLKIYNYPLCYFGHEAETQCSLADKRERELRLSKRLWDERQRLLAKLLLYASASTNGATQSWYRRARASSWARRRSLVTAVPFAEVLSLISCRAAARLRRRCKLLWVMPSWRASRRPMMVTLFLVGSDWSQVSKAST
jgi:hypothetical protein